MRPLLVSEVLLPPSAGVGRALGAGTLTLTGKVLHLLGDDLAPVFEVGLPEQVPLTAVTAAPNLSLVALATSSRVQVLTPRGDTLWSTRHRLPEVPGLSLTPSCLLDRSLMLWLFLPDEPNDHVVVLDARTGVEVVRIDLPTDAGQAQFTAHPDGVHVALRVDVGIETSATFWLRLAGDRLL